MFVSESNILSQNLPECNVLHPSCAVVVNVLLDLTLPLPRRWFVDWHLDRLLPVGHDDGTEGGVLSVHLRIIHRPETVKQKVLLVPVKYRPIFA